MTWNSLLLSKGSIFTFTQPSGTKAAAPTSSRTTPARNSTRMRALAMSGPMKRRYTRVSRSSRSCSPCPPACFNRRTAAQGVTMNATTSENIIAAEAPTGMGRMYGPISPPTNAIGRMAATTVRVARMVGLPTSSTARSATAAKPPGSRGVSRACRTTFSTTTMASSTRMPIEKMSAKSVMRLRV
jgi:hypothetical protein